MNTTLMVWIRVGLGIMAMKGYSALLKAPEQEPCHQIYFEGGWFLPLCEECSWRILNPADMMRSLLHISVVLSPWFDELWNKFENSKDRFWDSWKKGKSWKRPTSTQRSMCLWGLCSQNLAIRFRDTLSR